MAKTSDLFTAAMADAAKVREEHFQTQRVEPDGTITREFWSIGKGTHRAVVGYASRTDQVIAESGLTLTDDERTAVVTEANRRTNMAGGRYRDNLRSELARLPR